MSLNGLDSEPIQDAYQSAINEAGGWFLMKYSSRDAVELLAQGKSGVNGARNAIAAYEEASPLYGLLIYRRRKVLIKFIPEGTSRLLQARTAVHFQDVLERYSPYETLLEITNSEALNDTSLASAFPLHTASPAASSNRLHEISEDAEDSGSAPVERPLNSSASTGNVFGTQRYKMERRVEQIMQPDRVPPSIRVTGDTPPSPTSSSMKRPAISQFLIREDLGHTSIRSLDSPRSIASVTEYTASDTSSLHRLDSATAATPTATVTTVATSAPTSTAGDRQRPETPLTQEVMPERTTDTTAPTLPERSSVRPSVDAESVRAQTPVERPSLSDSVNGLVRSSTSTSGKTKYDDDIYDFTKYEYKPKVKLGPRPVAGADLAKRPTTASVAGVPSQYRSTAKKQETVRPRSQGATAVLASAPVAPPTLPAPPPIPSAAEYMPRPVSRGSIKSLPTHKTTAMTPDKIRLMKAVELRKKQLRKSNPQDSFQPPKEEDLMSIPPVPEVPAKSPQRLTPPGEHPPEVVDDQNNKADSGIELHYDRSIDAEPQQPLKETLPVPLAPSEPPTIPEEAPAVFEAPPAEPEPADLATPSAAPKSDEHGLLPASADDVEEPAKSVSPEEPQVDMEEKETESGDEFVDARSVSTPIPTLSTDNLSIIQAPVDVSAEEAPTDDVDVDDNAPDTLDDDLDNITPTEEIRSDSPKRQDSDLAKRRRGLVEPLQLEINPSGNPDDFMSDDDDFLEELRTAPVEQAKPIQVAKSPATVDFPGRRPSTASGVSDAGASVKSIRIKKSAAAVTDRSPENGTRLSPEPSQVPHYTPTGMVDKQDAAANGRGLARNVSSGISKRIQALAEVSSRESISKDNAPSRPLTPETSPNAFLQRDQRERTAMVRNTHKARPISFRRQSSKSSAASASTMVNVGDNAPVVSVQRDAAGNRNSVSVTARIVRPNAAREIASSSNGAKFQQSELSISTASASYQSQPAYTQHAESLHSVHSPGALSPPLSPISVESRSTSRFGRKQSATSPSPDDFPPPPTQRPTTSTSHKTEESASTKEGSRTSRFLKRMSNFGAGGKRKSNPQRSSAASSVPSGESVPVRTVEAKPALVSPEKPDTPPAVVVGDLNVQFPDSLLWKRRIVTIDENGNLQFAIAQAMEIHKSVAVKKFHLADFKLPYAPDLDYQELPHSVVLEFSDGTSLQVACEDAMTHRQVLHLLKTHWKAWAQSS